MVLPSKKVFSVFILIVALVAAIVIAFGRDKSSKAINIASNLVAGDKISIPENQNWQNELKNAGINTEPIKIEAGEEGETLTDTVSRTLMANYLALNQSNTLDQSSAQDLIDKTTNFIYKTTGKETGITKLNEIPDNGKQTMIDYGEKLGAILKNNNSKKFNSDMETFKKAVESDDSSKLGLLADIINAHLKLKSELLNMPVPKTFVKAHLDIVNGVGEMIAALEEAKSIFSDPVRGFAAIQTYQNGASKMIGALGATSQFIIKNNIVYKQGSGGYYLLYGV